MSHRAPQLRRQHTVTLAGRTFKVVTRRRTHGGNFLGWRTTVGTGPEARTYDWFRLDCDEAEAVAVEKFVREHGLGMEE